MPTTLSAQASMGTIDRFIQEVGAAEKRAVDKKAEEPLSEAGSQGGATSHPVKNVDDRLQAAEEGSRSAENESDVKEDQGKPGVNSTPEATSEGTKKAGFFDLSRFAKPIPGRTKRAEEGKSAGGAVQTPGSAADDHLQIGTKVEPTGEDPSVETSSAKAGKEDPGSKHPARTDNDQLDGHKYSSDQLDAMSLEQLAKIASDMGNDLCAAIAVDDEQPAKQAADGFSDADVAHQAGWELAGLMNGDFDKAAADALVQGTLEQVIKTASDDADRVAHFLDEFYAAREKKAEGEMPPDPSMGLPPPPGGEMPMGGEGGGADPAAMMGGGGGGEGDMMAALGGGEPPVGDAMGGAGGAGGDIDPQVLELAQVLSELGVTPEELEQAMAAQGGGGGGEEPPMEGGGEEPPLKEAAAKRGNTREGVREVIQEIITRSRRK